MPEQTTPIAETNRFIVLDKYVRAWEAANSYQSETDLERELVQDLHDQGYEYLPDLKTTDAMLANVRVQLQALNDVQFTDKEWARFVETYLDRPSDSATDRPASFTTTTSLTSSSMMAVSRTSIWLIRPMSAATRFRSLSSSSKRALMRTDTM
ncbi:type I restriction endonuclease [Paracoccus aminovorans]|uniref:type I restriction endonuclease n=1 Tax=Paracoccus aminovorans TaxID=34004 RepID=UPI0020A3EDD9|nr:type I restriction endonuclease [Paracoccus aminovorans]